MAESRTIVHVRIGSSRRSYDHFDDMRACLTKCAEAVGVEFLEFEVMPQWEAEARIAAAETEIATEREVELLLAAQQADGG
jgi:hypothetical protein